MNNRSLDHQFSRYRLENKRGANERSRHRKSVSISRMSLEALSRDTLVPRYKTEGTVKLINLAGQWTKCTYLNNSGPHRSEIF
jgi:hypothetical protein